MHVKLLAHTPRPNLLCYDAMHQCYSSEPIISERTQYEDLPDAELGRRLVKNCVSYGHWSVLEPAYFVFNAANFPHDVVVQARTHRHLSFSVQSQRYTFEKVYKLGSHTDSMPLDLLHDTFYFREIDSKYVDRDGHKYLYTAEDLAEDQEQVMKACRHFAKRLDKGFAPEHARHMLPQNIRQHFVMSCNARALLHFCDLRLPKNAQSEVRVLAQQVFNEFALVMPEVAQWYVENRYGKNKLAP